MPPRGGYRVKWDRFDNMTAVTAPIGESTIPSGERPSSPAPLPTVTGSFVRVEVSVVAPEHETWTPVQAYFRRVANEWMLVGLVRGGA